MEGNKRRYWFFGSKLNTVLLVVLIVLMSIALKWMSQQRELYFPTQSGEEKIMPGFEGNSDDLVSLSIVPGQQISGTVTITGSLKGAYFFEGSMPVALLDGEKKPTSYGPGYATATSDWMTTGPVSFTVTLDVQHAPAGLYYLAFTQDDPSDGESGTPPRSILVPVIVS